ncbi:hypothetical protein [Serratia sp. UGAL515B_01]|uniref:hypothetical protein n=1 Tax=Serratia sp. UGAL515B_01 TaxID=2986763 RepID=UPI002953D9CB|nr:hypothetical protein [Serratia sp. UGAL515B_01]WON78504.1 hypothetical protein OK023_07675 [Serratia sp. UGAL515B_01]
MLFHRRYTIDELEQRNEKEINPETTATRVSVSQLADTPPASPQQSSTPPVDSSGIAAEIRTAIEQAKDTEKTTAIRAQVEDLKQQLGITDYTELKNKVVKRHRQILAASTISTQLDDCCSYEDFTAIEALVRRSERDLSADDLERFQIILDDMRPEFKE